MIKELERFVSGSTRRDVAVFLSLLGILEIPSVSLCAEKRAAPIPVEEVSSFSKAEKIAVLVGIETYPQGSGLTQLTYAEDDVDGLAIVLERQGYLVRPIKGAQATRAVVEDTVTAMKDALTGSNATFLFYFSGHGFQVDGDNYLATYEASAKRLKSTGLSLAAVEKLLADSGAQRRILLIDACRDKAEAGKTAAERSFANFSAATGSNILFSTKSGSLSYEYDSLKHGLYTYFLLKGLQGEAAAADGLVTFRDLSQYMFEAMRSHSVPRGQMQIPYAAGEAAGDFLLAHVIGEPQAQDQSEKKSEDYRGGGTDPDGGQRRAREADHAIEVLIPSGAFAMGSADNEEDEKPIHRVALTRSYWMDQHEVTVGQYYAVVGLLPDGNTAGDDHPVVNVEWAEATNYCKKVGGRLPTEAEWERAARGGMERKIYPWGDAAVCVASKCRANGAETDPFPKTAPVCKFSPNPYGLCDMAGNVWEWVQDWYSAYPRTELTDPSGPDAGTFRVLRGGSWNDVPATLRAANRVNYDPGNRYNNIGFRCVRGSE